MFCSWYFVLLSHSLKGLGQAELWLPNERPTPGGFNWRNSVFMVFYVVFLKL